MKIFTFLPKVFMGDSGSLTIGFIFSFITIYYSQYKVFIHSSVLIWPIAFVLYGFLTINLIRLSLKKNIFKRDLPFLFNLLQNNVQRKESAEKSRSSSKLPNMSDFASDGGLPGVGGMGDGLAGLAGMLGGGNFKELMDIFESLKGVFIVFKNSFKKLTEMSNLIVFVVSILFFLISRN